MQTASGRMFYPLDPRPDEIHIEDIAAALSRICRFGGHCRAFYSVAQHSVLVSEHSGPGDELWGLLHDASEAYLGDLIRPLKRQECMSSWRKAEAAVMSAVRVRFQLPGPRCGRCDGEGRYGPYGFWDCEACNRRGWLDMPASVKYADEVLLKTEARDLMGNETLETWSSLQGVRPLATTIEPWAPHYAEERFLERFHLLRA